MDAEARSLIVIGASLIVAGFAWHMGWIQALRLGHLPGDIRIERENLRVYFPLTTCIILGLIFTLISWLIRKF